MSTALLLAVLCAFLFGSYLFVVKRYFSAYPATVYLFLVFAFAFLWYVPVVATVNGSYLPGGFGRTGIIVFAATVGFTLLGNLTFFRAIAVGAVSYVAPISKVIPVFVLPLEVLLLGQYLSPLQVVGALVATVAIYVANYQPGELLEPLQRAVAARPAQLALASAASFAVVDVGKRTLMQELSLPPQTYVVVLFASVAVGLAPFAVRNWPTGEHAGGAHVVRSADGGTPVQVRSDLPKFAATGLLFATANHALMFAFVDLPASIASPVVNTQAVVAVLLGGLLLDEEYFRIRLVAAGLAVVGVGAIALG